MFSCDEHLGGRDPSHGSELCTVVETMFSLEQSLAILGDPTLGDRLEKIAFNALPGTFTDDMWAHQYDQEPNQVECSLHTKPWSTNGPESNLYGLEPNFACCTANFHQGWPKFAASLFMLSQEEDLVAAVYSPCEAHANVFGTPVHIVEETEYPFRGNIRMVVNPSSRLRFALRLRIPAWAEGASIAVNGKQETPPVPRSFSRIERIWERGDLVEITFPFEPRASRWFNNSVAIERGPLVLLLWYRRKLAQTSRPRDECRLASLSDHAVELCDRSFPRKRCKRCFGRRVSGRQTAIQRKTCRRCPQCQSAKIALLAERRRRSQSCASKSSFQRWTSGGYPPHPLCVGESSDHRVSATRKMNTSARK
jgi:DUF1680 family protein